jgi:hypothetical protein
MYWGSDKKSAESLVTRAREIETMVKSIRPEEEAKTDICEDREILEKCPIDRLMEY